MPQKQIRTDVFLNPNILVKQCVIGCTTLPSRDDPELEHGVALTILNAHDRKYVKFEDIAREGDTSYRYWKDVYLIVPWNDKQYAPLKPGDSVFALFEIQDKTMTTIYYNATIKELPSSSNGNQIIIDYDGDESNEYCNIPIRQFTQVQTKTGKIIVPTVIRRIGAEDSKQLQIALINYKNNKKTNRLKRKYEEMIQEEQELKLCKICFDEEKEYAVQPCGHLCLCHKCSENIKKTTKVCPICRKKGVYFQKIFY